MTIIQTIAQSCGSTVHSLGLGSGQLSNPVRYGRLSHAGLLRWRTVSLVLGRNSLAHHFDLGAPRAVNTPALPSEAPLHAFTLHVHQAAEGQPKPPSRACASEPCSRLSCTSVHEGTGWASAGTIAIAWAVLLREIFI